MQPSRLVMPYLVAVSLFCALLLLLVHHGLNSNAGTFVYPLDDAYIHLAVSRNLALHRVWGISRTSFSGASSSPAWTILLACVTRLFGVHLLTPLLINALAALLLLFVGAVVLARVLPDAGFWYLTFALCALVLIAPLPGVALIGMEHVLHAVVTLLFVASAARIISFPLYEKSAVILLLLSAFLSGALRYESCFAVGVVVILLVVRRRLKLAFATAFSAAVGPVSYAFYSHAHSGVFLPFSVIMKASSPSEHHGFNALASSDISPILISLAVVFFLRMAQRAIEPAAIRSEFWSFTNCFLIITIATTIMHAEVGPHGWLMRYEAYLYVLGATALAIALYDGRALIQRPSRRRGWIVASLMVALLPVVSDLLHRVHHGYSDFAASLHDRYVEHLSQALFVRAEMPNAVVLANDIGFLAFYAPDVKILDPLGLGSIEPVQLVRKHQAIDPDFVAHWASDERATLAILHTDFPGIQNEIPTRWVLVESWCFPHNVVFENHVESFYAPDVSDAQSLRSKLAEFHDLSPEIVRYRFPRSGGIPPEPVRGETAICPAPI